MYKLRLLLKKIHTPITIMLIPHSRFSSRSVKIPVVAAAFFCVLACVGAIFSVSLTIQAFDYYRMKGEYTRMSENFNEMESTMASLKQSESQFRKLFSLGSRKAEAMIIGEGAYLLGDISSKTMLAAGRITGNVHSVESVEIQPRGEVCGDIYTSRLTVAEGGVFEGRSYMQKSRELEYKPVES